MLLQLYNYPKNQYKKYNKHFTIEKPNSSNRTHQKYIHVSPYLVKRCYL